jgi:iron complex outermembrane receptor protein
MAHLRLWRCLLLAAGCSVVAAIGAQPTESTLQEIQQLGDIHAESANRQTGEVTSVGKKTQRASEAAAAIFVITQDDIRRSGVTSIAEALRLAPGIHVARVDSSHWAVSARGFNGVFANKLLVLMDGREVYASSFGGVYWDVQDYPLDDIDRIEVIRGPGASLWGANAVNGVINIITKPARETQGGSLRAGGGNLEQGFGSLRYGAQLGDQTYGRVYAKGTNRGAFMDRTHDSAHDNWNMTQTGFRVDHDNEAGTALSLLGSAYQSDFRQQLALPSPVPPYHPLLRDSARSSGFNLLGRWREALSLSSEFTLQAFASHDYRLEGYGAQERNMLDLEAQHRFLLGARHDINWGMGYRLLHDDFGGTSYAAFSPRSARKQLASLFLQDDISLIANELKLTLGAKLQHNDYTGFEGQPSGRLLWTPNPQHAFWLAVSRAVRTPTRADCCIRAIKGVFAPDDPSNPINQVPGVPLQPLVWGAHGNPDLSAERVMAYETGYRYNPNAQLSVDLALFYNRYRSLRGWDAWQFQYQFRPGYIEALMDTQDNLSASSWGSELAVTWKPMDVWTLDAVYSYLNVNVSQLPTTLSFDDGTTPQQQAYLRSGLELTDAIDLDLWLRYSDSAYRPASSVKLPGYLTLDARLAWRPVDRLELSIAGQNLLQASHVEFSQEILGPPQVRVPRSYYLQLSWQF